ncbi:unnamed protein product, partial [Pleuronectes platessa]
LHPGNFEAQGHVSSLMVCCGCLGSRFCLYHASKPSGLPTVKSGESIMVEVRLVPPAPPPMKSAELNFSSRLFVTGPFSLLGFGDVFVPASEIPGLNCHYASADHQASPTDLPVTCSTSLS